MVMTKHTMHLIKHLEELEMFPKEDLTICEFRSIYSSGKFQQFCPPTQKPFSGLVAILNNLVMRDIMISTNEEGLLVKNEAHGMRTVVGPKVLWTVANAGFTPMTMAASKSFCYWGFFSKKVKDKLCPDADFSSITVLWQ